MFMCYYNKPYLGISSIHVGEWCVLYVHSLHQNDCGWMCDDPNYKLQILPCFCRNFIVNCCCLTSLLHISINSCVCVCVCERFLCMFVCFSLCANGSEWADQDESHITGRWFSEAVVAPAELSLALWSLCWSYFSSLNPAKNVPNHWSGLCSHASLIFHQLYNLFHRRQESF